MKTKNKQKIFLFKFQDAFIRIMRLAGKTKIKKNKKINELRKEKENKKYTSSDLGV